MSRVQASPVTLAWFGKLPSRGDFVRSGNQPQLTQTLDRWLTQTMEQMAADVAWKRVYDEAPPAHFAFLGTQGKLALAGHLVASVDASGRRFPFVLAGLFEVPAGPPGFLQCAPMALTRLWSRLEAVSGRACAAEADPGAVLGEVVQASLEVDAEPGAYRANFQDFLALHTVGSLESQLRQAGHVLSLRQTVLALGLLLQPVVTHGAAQLERGLMLPTAADPLYRALVAAWWLALVTPFLQRRDVELSVFLRSRPAEQLVLGFNGASSRTLRALMDPAAAEHDLIPVSMADWVEDQVGQSYALRKLSSHLEQPDLPLQAALDGFLETFIPS